MDIFKWYRISCASFKDFVVFFAPHLIWRETFDFSKIWPNLQYVIFLFYIFYNRGNSLPFLIFFKKQQSSKNVYNKIMWNAKSKLKKKNSLHWNTNIQYETILLKDLYSRFIEPLFYMKMYWLAVNDLRNRARAETLTTTDLK